MASKNWFTASDSGYSRRVASYSERRKQDEQDALYAQQELEKFNALRAGGKQNPDGSITPKKPSFLDFLNPIGEHGIFGKRNTAQVSHTAGQLGDWTRKKIDEAIGEEGNDKLDSANDVTRFAANLIPGMIEGLGQSGKNFHEAASGKRLELDDNGQWTGGEEDLSGIQRLAAGTIGTLDTVGVGLGGSGKFVKEIFKKPLENALKTVVKKSLTSEVKDTAKRSGVESIEEGLSSVASDLQDDGQLSEDWLTNVGKSMALGFAAGGMFDVGGRAIGAAKSAVNGARVNKQTNTPVESSTSTNAPAQSTVTKEQAERLVRVDTQLNERIGYINERIKALQEGTDPSVRRVVASDGTNVTAVVEKYNNDIKNLETQIRDLQQQADGINNNTGKADIPEAAMAEIDVEADVTTGGRKFTSEVGNPISDMPTEVIKTDGGYVRILPNSPYAPENLTSIVKVMVDEGNRRQGIGSSLIKEAMKKYGRISAFAENEASQRMNYKLGMRLVDKPNATLDEVLALGREQGGGVTMVSPETPRLNTPKAPVRVYHGSNTSLEGGKPKPGRVAHKGGGRTTTSEMSFFSDNKDTSDFFAKDRTKNLGGKEAVTEYDLDESDILDWSNLKDNADLYKEFSKLGYSLRELEAPKGDFTSLLDTKRFKESIQKAGYKGVKFKERDGITYGIVDDSVYTPAPKVPVATKTEAKTSTADPSEYTGDVEGRAKAAERIPKLRQKIEELKLEQSQQFEMLGGVSDIIDNDLAKTKMRELKSEKAQALDWKLRNNIGETASSIKQKIDDIDNGVISDELVEVREQVDSVEAAVQMAEETDPGDVSQIQRAAVINQIHREAANNKMDTLWTQEKADSFETEYDANYHERAAEIKEMPGPKQKAEMEALDAEYIEVMEGNAARVQSDMDEVVAVEQALKIADDIDARIVERANDILESNPTAFGRVDDAAVAEVRTGLEIAHTLKKAEEASADSKYIRASDLSTDDARRSPEVTPEKFEQHRQAGQIKMDMFNNTKVEPTAIINDEQWSTIVDDSYNASRDVWGGETYNAVTGEKVAKDADAYALTIRDEGMDTVSVLPTASKAEFAKAMETAKQKYAHILENEGAHLGVFNDADKGTIDIDPVLITSDLADVHDIGAYTKALGGAYHFKSGDGYWPPHIADDANTGEAPSVSPIESEDAVRQSVRNAADVDEATTIINEDPRLSEEASVIIADQVQAGNLKGGFRDHTITTMRDGLLKMTNGDKVVAELDGAIMASSRSNNRMTQQAKADKWKLAWKDDRATDQSIAYWDKGEPITRMKGESQSRFEQRQTAVDSVKSWLRDKAEEQGLSPEQMITNYFPHNFQQQFGKGFDATAEAIARLESGINKNGKKLTDKQRNMLERQLEGVDLGTRQMIEAAGIYKVGKNGHLNKRQGAEGWSKDIPFVLDMYERMSNQSTHMQPALDNIKAMTTDLRGTQLHFLEDALDAVTGKKTRGDEKLGSRGVKVVSTSRRLSNLALMGLSARTVALQPFAIVNNWREAPDSRQFIMSTMQSMRALKPSNTVRTDPVVREFLEAGGMEGSFSASLKSGKMTKIERGMMGGIALVDRTLRLGAYDMGKADYAKKLGKDLDSLTPAEYDAAKAAGVAMARKAQFGVGPMDIPLAQSSEVGKMIFQLQQFNMKQLGKEADYLIGKGGLFRKSGWIDEKTGNLNAKGAKNLVKTLAGYSAMYALYTQIAMPGDEEGDSKNPFGFDVQDILPFGEQLGALLEFATTGEIKDEVQAPIPPVISALVGRGGSDKGVVGHLYAALTGGEDTDSDRELAGAMKSAIRNFLPGGTQGVRTFEGAKAVSQGESKNLSGSTRFLVDNESGWNIIKGLVAGQYATTEGQEWLRNGMNTINKNATVELSDGSKMPVSEYVRAVIKDPQEKAAWIGYYATKQNAEKQLKDNGMSRSDKIREVSLRLTSGQISQGQATAEIERYNDTVRELYRPYYETVEKFPPRLANDFLEGVLINPNGTKPVSYRQMDEEKFNTLSEWEEYESQGYEW